MWETMSLCHLRIDFINYHRQCKNISKRISNCTLDRNDNDDDDDGDGR